MLRQLLDVYQNVTAVLTYRTPRVTFLRSMFTEERNQVQRTRAWSPPLCRCLRPYS